MGFPYCDVTTQTLFKGDRDPYRVEIVSKHPLPIVFSGELLISALMKRLTKDWVIDVRCPDGGLVQTGDLICTLTGDANSLMMAERTLLNFLRHLCAVSTMTYQFVQAVAGTKLKILDTRKTMPGLRHLEKYAVYCGGGVNHRMGLYDAIMIKDNHVDLSGGMANALNALPEKPACPVIVEVRTQNDLKVLLEKAQGRVTRVLLDNMTPSQLADVLSYVLERFLQKRLAI